MEHVFVDLPERYEAVYLYERQPDARGKPAAFRQVLWGDFLWLDEAHVFDPHGEWTMVVWAKADPDKRRELRVRTSQVSADRPLEIIFVDVGQGDGSVLITPERGENERIIVIDAGQGDDMGRFLDGRFGAYRSGFRFHAAVITHPDKDHYYGFAPIFADPKIKFDQVYHSGLVERPVSNEWAKLGGKTKEAGGKRYYCDNLCEDDATFRSLFAAPVDVKRYTYPRTVRGALDNGNVGKFLMLAKDGAMEDRSWMPGFAPADGRSYTIEVLGPVIEPDPVSGKKRLRCFPDTPRTTTGNVSYSADAGKTKNGHSVLLRLSFGGFNVLFGGDLNRPAEEFLLSYYGAMDGWPELGSDREEMVARAAPRLRSEVMKTCHHGSSDVTDEFLEAVNPAAFVISSGDQEGHVHPRPDLLGRLGKKGRGTAPVLLSTELQRSWREAENAETVAALTARVRALSAAPSDTLRDTIIADIERLGGSNVSVDGAIYVKTDGSRLMAAFKKETQSPTDRWFYFEYRIVNGNLLLIKRGDH